MQLRGVKMLVSIVGKSGSGKSYISDILKSYNQDIIYVSIDEIGHEVLEKAQVREELIKHFGKFILEADKISRKQLSKIVFNSKEKMQILTDITWASMEEIIDNIIFQNSTQIILLDWLLLPKTKYFTASDLKILVTSPLETRMKRAMKRDNITKEKFLEREQAAIDVDKYHYDYTIENTEETNLKEQVKLIYEQSIISR